MKTLIISYLPGGEYSNTKKLFDHLIHELKDNDVEHLNLLEEHPDFITHDMLMAYYARNYQGKKLSSDQRKLMKKMDKFTNQVDEADIVIMAFPMHNFGMPGIIKTWFDNIMQAGVAFEYGPQGPTGLFKNKKALVLFTSGGSYSNEKVSLQYPEWDTLSFLSKIEFTFMGFRSTEIISASTSDPKKLDENIGEAKGKISEIISKWY